MEEKRLFIAIPLTEVYKDTLRQFQNAQDQKFRWISEPNWHLTLLFMGSFPRSSIAALTQTLHQFFQRQPSVSLTPKAFLFAPKLAKARMIWLRFHESQPFDDLVNSLYQTLEGLYADLDLSFSIQLHEKQIPHVTLARFKPFNAYNQAWLKERQLVDELPELIIDKAILMESIRKQEGAEYHVLEKFSFKDPPH